MNTKIKALFELAKTNKASDIHVQQNKWPKIRVDGQLVDVSHVEGVEFLPTQEDILSVLDETQKQTLISGKEIDFSLDLGTVRFRVNVYFQRGELAAVFRLVPLEIPVMAQLKLPPVLSSFLELKQGFVLVTGPTGQGKSTTVASMLNEINISRSTHIVTIEDPIEYILNPAKSVISQREVGGDTNDFNRALRSCLRQDPNVVFVGEMRDLETISLALTVAETGHLVFSTLHTNSAAQTIDRIIDVFPDSAKAQVRIQMSTTLTAVVSQRLLPAVGGGRVAAFEVLIVTPAVRNAIREGKTFMIDNIIQTSADVGMMSLDMSLAKLIAAGLVTEEVAQAHCLRPDEFRNYLRAVRLK